MPLTRLDIDDAVNLGRKMADDMLREAKRAYNKPYTEALRQVLWTRFLESFAAMVPHMGGMSAGDVEKYLRAADNSAVDRAKTVFDNMEVDDGTEMG